MARPRGKVSSEWLGRLQSDASVQHRRYNSAIGIAAIAVAAIPVAAIGVAAITVAFLGPF
jgi:hypothetical protein